MGVDYIIDEDCELKKATGGAEGLIEHIKKKGILDTLLEVFKKEDPKGDPYKKTFVRQQLTPEGVKEHEVSLGQIKQETAWLEQWAEFCGKCPLCFSRDEMGRGEVGGCYGSISYPVSQYGEALVAMTVDIIHTDLREHQAHLLLDYILDNGVNAERTQKMRASGRMFFERPGAIDIKIDEGKVITTDQVFELLFQYDFSPDYIKLVFAPFMDALGHVYQNAPPDLKKAFDADRTVPQLIIFGNALKLAANSSKNVLKSA